MRRQTKLVVQGIPGSFHDEVARNYFGHNRVEIVAAKSFNVLAQILHEDASIHYGVMAIENSIAGSILQNYKILRENKFLDIRRSLFKNQSPINGPSRADHQELHTVESHPMAIYQCTEYFNDYRHITLMESPDTALSAKKVSEQKLLGVGAIGSKLAADLYGLEILGSDIETSKVNYTRFIIISRKAEYSSLGNADKASVYLRVPHKHGSLMKVLQHLDDFKINISKLQSFPVLGEFNTYYFHLDLEFDDIVQYENCIEEIRKVSTDLEEIGVYKKAVIP